MDGYHQQMFFPNSHRRMGCLWQIHLHHTQELYQAINQMDTDLPQVVFQTLLQLIHHLKAQLVVNIHQEALLVGRIQFQLILLYTIVL